MKIEIEPINNLRNLLKPPDPQKRDGKYIMAAKYNGEYTYLGRFDNLDEAKNVLIDFRYNRLKTSVEKYNLNLEEAKIVNKNYIVFKTGDIFNLSGNKLIGSMNNHGYRVCTINHKTICIHRIVGTAFIDNPNNYPQINHKDGNKLNNNVDNLEWCTGSHNIQHAYDTGLKIPPVGEKWHRHKLTEEQVRYIKSHYIPYDTKFGVRALAKTLNINEYTIRSIVNDNNWGWLKVENEDY